MVDTLSNNLLIDKMLRGFEVAPDDGVWLRQLEFAPGDINFLQWLKLTPSYTWRMVIGLSNH